MLEFTLTDEQLACTTGQTGWSRKLWALIQADRVDDAVLALGRFDEGLKSIRPITRAEAKEMVEASVTDWPTAMVVPEEWIEEHAFGWAIGCQTAKYLESGDIQDMVIGHRPFIVDKYTGALWATGSGCVDPVSNYQASGNPLIYPA